MSDMQRNKGIIKRLSTKETTKEVYNKLIKDGLHDPKWDETDEDGTPVYIDSDKYQLIDGCMFDISDAPRETDGEDYVEEVERLNDTDYKIHLYFYNGGGSMDEILDEAVPKADEEYEKNSKKNTFYAIKFKDGSYWSRGSNTAPSTFSTEGRARGTANNVSVRLNPDSYDIVKLVEQ